MKHFTRSLQSLTGVLLILGFLFTQCFSQSADRKKLELNGYVKYLQTVTYADGPLFPLSSNLIHNRLNLKIYPDDKWTITVEARNRLFFGEQLKLDPTFSDAIDQYDGLVDLSIRWADNKSVFLHSIIDRAYVNYATEKWDVRLGRQRINWGLNLVWNPNDLFNALNFLDFDYEERPGRDALRVQYYTGLLSSIEVAVAPDDTLKNSIAAALYKFNTQGYDVQVLAGYMAGDVALGGGWEGNIKGAGFKGEGTVFIPTDYSPDTATVFSGAASVDYMFGGGLYMTGGFLYNSAGKNAGFDFGNNGILGGGTQLSAKNLFPAEWAFLVQGSGSITPLFSASGAVIYAPTDHLTAFIPTLTYSIKENWDIDLIGQTFFLSLPVKGYSHLASAAYFRLKWSF